MPDLRKNGQVNNDEFRRHAHDVVDWIADYFEELPKRAVIPDVSPGDIRKLLPKRRPRRASRLPR